MKQSFKFLISFIVLFSLSGKISQGAFNSNLTQQTKFSHTTIAADVASFVELIIENEEEGPGSYTPPVALITSTNEQGIIVVKSRYISAHYKKLPLFLMKRQLLI